MYIIYGKGFTGLHLFPVPLNVHQYSLFNLFMLQVVVFLWFVCIVWAVGSSELQTHFLYYLLLLYTKYINTCIVLLLSSPHWEVGWCKPSLGSWVMQALTGKLGDASPHWGVGWSKPSYGSWVKQALTGEMGEASPHWGVGWNKPSLGSWVKQALTGELGEASPHWGVGWSKS